MKAYSAGFRFLTILTLVFAIITLIFGASTTSNEAGMAFEDWLTSDGHWLYGFPWSKLAYGTQGFFEHHHRECAGMAGLLTVALWIWSRFLTVPGLTRRLCDVAVVFVIIQGTFGGLTVLMDLKQPVWSIFHATLGQLYVAVLAMLAASVSKFWLNEGRHDIPQFKLVNWLPGLLLFQLILGAVYRHTGMPHAVMLHMVFAFVVAAAAGMVILKMFSDAKEHKKLLSLSTWLGVMLFIQLTLGFVALAQRAGEGGLNFKKRAEVGAHKEVTVDQSRSLTATAHVLVGALMLATACCVRLHMGRSGTPPQDDA